MNTNFDWKTYIENYDDLQKAGINTPEKAWYHWVNYGKQEGRTYENNDKKYFININENFEIFDWKRYIKEYNLNLIDKNKTWKHWLSYGKRENKFFYTINTLDNIKNTTNEIIIYIYYVAMNKN